ncbi:MAG: molybdopterin-dependent oxidoreductase [Rhodospirillales bacterium]|jgi:phenylacetyl-CoA:acceptor oxidoreductase|nr:molybdopterin oxidoreductase [Rhodospirillaceae bacterium]MDP6426791.1 molybdopterin-dependent oxidoreductase [Rhodospirillales bacterium]MDP6842171.1 molybdopterin-dependent oxidoreductase [Rhodospirillales bacterium]
MTEKDIKKVTTFCNQCVAGPDLITVKVEDGVAVEIEPCFQAAEVHPAGGRACVKAFGLLQKTYNPNRLRTPMKRTNPKKGKGENPGFVPISWDEALDIVAGRLQETRAKGVLDASGYARLAVSLGGGGTPVAYAGTLPALMAAWGPVDFSFGSGQGVKCTHSEHLYGEFWHRGFTVCPDTPMCNYLVSFGAGTESASGVCGVRRHADARVRGIKRVQIEPHLSVTGACSAEWIPIKPKTDAAFLLAMVHVALYENSRDRLDIPFLKTRTSSPYLVAPNGYFMRDPETRKPLVWDNKSEAAVAHDVAGIDPALEGAFSVSGIEVGADDDIWHHEQQSCATSFTILVDKMASQTPEMAGEICDLPADSIRRVANEFLDHACIGETVEIDGHILPYRPVSISLGKTVNNGWGGYECCWGRTMMACLVGGLEVPGGLLGTMVRINKSGRDRLKSVEPGPDGFMFYPLNPTARDEWDSTPNQRHAGRMLVPLVGNSGYAQSLGPTQLGWMTQKDGAFPKMPEMTAPDIWITFRTNPVVSFWDTDELEKSIVKFPFVAAFSYTHDETNHYADILLPECTDLESTQIIRIGGTSTVEAYWEHQGFCLRQPAVEPLGDVRDMTWIATELAKRSGMLAEYNRAINKGATGVSLRTQNYDFSLDENEPHSVEEIWNAACRSASAEVTGGEHTDGLDYYRDHGFRVSDFAKINWYLTPELEKQGLRYELPYQERLLRTGRQLGNRLHEKDIDWWDKQLAEYAAIPVWHDIPGIWEKALEKEYDCDIGDYPFWAITARSMQYAWGANVGIQMIKEVADNIAGHGGVILNAGRARELGIEDGSLVEIKAPSGNTVRGLAVPRQGIRPDTILMVGQFNHWVTPMAKDFDVPSVNKLIPMLLDLTDNTGSGADLARASIRPLDKRS